MWADAFGILVQIPVNVVEPFESLLQQVASLLKLSLESIALLIVLFAMIVTLRKLLRRSRWSRFETTEAAIRLELGLFLGLSLEFLLAADIVGTAVSPNWDALGKLAAIAVIRTFLNYFLQKEVHELEAQAEQRNQAEIPPR